MEDFFEIFNRLWQHQENEVAEFKTASESYDFDDLGKYFSALSNEANLRGFTAGWFIMGVFDKKHQIVGTNYKNGEKALNQVKRDVAQHTTAGLTFREIVPLEIEGKRVLVFKVPASPRNIVMHWKGIAYGRAGESLVPLDQAKIDEIRHQDPIPDWSAELVPSATMSDLDEMALAKARIMYKKVHERIPPEEIDAWTIEEFLSNSRVMRDGQLTRAAMLLLGKPTSLYKLHPVVAQITWTLVDSEDIVQDYEHFSIPFIITVDEVLAKIRNYTLREMPGGTLFPDTMKQYDDYTIREALHNCIAHQDYRMQQRINFVEGPSTLYYSNGGSFIPGTLADVLEHKGPQRHYRNACLCEAMVNYNMIDTVGRGIKKMFSEQKRRYFPMPDYEIDNDKREVGVTIYGKMLDERYTRALKDNSDLTMRECIMLDAIQKGHPLSPEARKYLKNRHLIEGKSPHYTISLSVAKMTHQLSQYTKDNGLDRDKLQQMVLQFIENSGDEGAKRDAIYDYIKDVLPANRTIEQQQRLLSNVLSFMKLNGVVLTKGRRWFVI